jgi:hypothetical protein
VTPLYVRPRTASARGGRGVAAGADPTSRRGDYRIPALASLRPLGRDDVPGPTRSQAPADVMPAKRASSRHRLRDGRRSTTAPGAYWIQALASLRSLGRNDGE